MPVSTATSWIVARAKSGRESWAQENVSKHLRTLGLPETAAYFPRTSAKVRSLVMARPLFGPYFFAQVRGAWHFLLNTYGVSGVVLFGEVPAAISDDQILLIKQREVDGLVVLPAAPPISARWRYGERVRVKGGVFSGNFGIYQGMASRQRERVLTEFLGRKTSVLIATEMLEAAA